MVPLAVDPQADAVTRHELPQILEIVAQQLDHIEMMRHVLEHVVEKPAGARRHFVQPAMRDRFQAHREELAEHFRGNALRHAE